MDEAYCIKEYIGFMYAQCRCGLESAYDTINRKEILLVIARRTLLLQKM